LSYCIFVLIQSGPDNYTEETVGVNYRALKDLFQISDQRKDTIHYDISVQMLEIYNEQVRDLLSADSAHKRYPFLYNKLVVFFIQDLCMHAILM